MNYCIGKNRENQQTVIVTYTRIYASDLDKKNQVNT